MRGIVALVATSLLLAAAWRSAATRPCSPGDGGGPLAAVASRPLDLNRASPSELASLPGLGAALAQRIVEDRIRRGPFGSVSELDRVRGIGPGVLRRIEGRVSVESP